MGTLTADVTRLAEYCEHKLPTSCRLSSIPQCCACADERAHAASYSTYIDGIGFVPRGTRWQRYCWFCKQFWENRVEASGLRPAQTRVPEVPDQTEFLERWYEFHQGYRIIKNEDGSEDRVAVLGEDFRDVSPGHLPRTLEELRSGVAASDVARAQSHAPLPEQAMPAGPSLEDTLDNLFQAAEQEHAQAQGHVRVQPDRPSADGSFAPASALGPMEEEIRRVNMMTEYSNILEQRNSRNIHAQAMAAADSQNRDHAARRIAALRRELHRMRSGIERVISGLRELGENVPDHTVATDRLGELGRTLEAIDGAPSQAQAERAIESVNTLSRTSAPSATDRSMASLQGRVDEARNHFNEARRILDQVASEHDLAEREYRIAQQRLQQLQREQRTAENYMRLFGTREEMLAQGDQYESPIGGMFQRAYDRFHVAEEVRRAERNLRMVLDDEARAGSDEAARRVMELSMQQRDVWGVPRPPEMQPTSQQPTAPVENDLPLEARSDLEEYYNLIRQQDRSQQASRPDNATNPARGSTQREASIAESTMAHQLSELGAPDDSLPATAEERHADYAHILSHFLTDGELMAENMMTPEHVYSFLADLGNDDLNPIRERELSDMLDRPRVVWGSRLIAARFLRRRRVGACPTLIPNVSQDNFQRTAENIEIMAEAFQMSAALRRRAPGVTAPQQLQMLYRLQAGERQMEDVAKLGEMLRDEGTFTLASIVHGQGTHDPGAVSEDTTRLDQLEEQRRASARDGDHSRRELDSQRRATSQLALAAAGRAMLTGPATLFEQMTARDNETRAAYERLQQNGFVPAGNTPAERLLRQNPYRTLNFDTLSSSESDSEEEEVGLDAKDSGRPEPKSEEGLSVTMECRICYTQLAEIACLPCGHLVMCKWCSDQHSPVMAHDRTRPRRAAACPVCRKGIKQKVKVFRA
jgi:hypothetical protein